MTTPFRTIGLAAATALLATLQTTPVAAQTRVLLNCFFPPQHFGCQKGMAGWAEAVTQATEGRVRVAVLPQTMAPPPEQLISVRAGVFDGAFQMNGFIQNEVVGPQLSMLPFTGGSDARANSVALWRTYEQFMAQADEYQGVELLGLFVAPGADFYSLTDRPILSVADLAALKMWAAAGSTAEMMIAAGSPVVSGPAVQMTELIQRGVVDGFVGIPATDARAFNVLPSARSATTTEYKILTPTFSFFISDAKWAEISPEDQEKIRALSGEAFAELLGGLYSDVESEVLAAREQAITVHTASAEFEAELAALSERWITDWIEKANAIGIDGAAALDFYKAEVARLSQ